MLLWTPRSYEHLRKIQREPTCLRKALRGTEPNPPRPSAAAGPAVPERPGRRAASAGPARESRGGTAVPATVRGQFPARPARSASYLGGNEMSSS